jgi:hypothetical protein
MSNLNSTKLSSIDAKINLLKAKAAAINTRLNAYNNNHRKARTRTLIQLGGIISLTNLVAICDINQGDDLQIDIESQDKAAILLGLLVELNESLPESFTCEQLNFYQNKGIQYMKNHDIKKSRSIKSEI